MSSNRTQEKKEFLSATRKKVGSGMTTAPVWAMQKKGDRIWNKRQKRHWRQTDLGNLFKKTQRKQGKDDHANRVKSGKKKRKSGKMKRAEW